MAQPTCEREPECKPTFKSFCDDFNAIDSDHECNLGCRNQKPTCELSYIEPHTHQRRTEDCASYQNDEYWWYRVRNMGCWDKPEPKVKQCYNTWESCNNNFSCDRVEKKQSCDVLQKETTFTMFCDQFNELDIDHNCQIGCSPQTREPTCEIQYVDHSHNWRSEPCGHLINDNQWWDSVRQYDCWDNSNNNRHLEYVWWHWEDCHSLDECGRYKQSENEYCLWWDWEKTSSFDFRCEDFGLNIHNGRSLSHWTDRECYVQYTQQSCDMSNYQCKV